MQTITIKCANCQLSYCRDREGNFKPACICYGRKDKKPFTCPVCTGTGALPFNFYGETGYYNFGEGTSGTISWTTSTGAKTTCRSCNGKGLVWRDEE